MVLPLALVPEQPQVPPGVAVREGLLQLPVPEVRAEQQVRAEAEAPLFVVEVAAY